MTVAVALAFITAFAIRASDAQQCIGDCNSDGRVSVSELVTGVEMALSGGDTCPAMECNDTGLGIFLNCLVVAVNNALDGCDPASVDAVWLYYIACRQCGDCPFQTINDLLGIARDGIPDDVIAAGMTVIDSRIEWVQGACLACSCPAPGSPIYHVLVARADVEQLVAIGWVVEP